MKRKGEHFSYKLARLKPLVLTVIALLTAFVSHKYGSGDMTYDSI
jgi:hypothetical protein